MDDYVTRANFNDDLHKMNCYVTVSFSHHPHKITLNAMMFKVIIITKHEGSLKKHSMSSRIGKKLGLTQRLCSANTY